MVLPRNIIKMRSTLKLFIRDWAKEVNNFFIFLLLKRAKRKEILATSQY